MATVHEMNHPLIKHKLSLMRDKTTGVKEFREAAAEIAMLMCYEATRDLPLKEITIETPVAEARVQVISGKKIALVPILRAGLGMVEGILEMIPAAKVGHIGLYRNPETLQPIEYYCKLPNDIEDRDVLLLDPMLATGGSAIAAIDGLKRRGSATGACARSRSFHCAVLSAIWSVPDAPCARALPAGDADRRRPAPGGSRLCPRGTGGVRRRQHQIRSQTAARQVRAADRCSSL